MAQNFKKFEADLLRVAKTHGTTKDVRACQLVLSETAQFLNTAHAMRGNLTTGSLENLGSETIPVLNSDMNVLSDVGAEQVMALMERCKVPENKRYVTAVEVMRILDGGIDKAAIFAREPESAEHVAIESYAGMSGAASLRHDDKVALEAFGTDIDRLQADNRLNIVLTILRSFSSLIDKMLPRVNEEGNVVTLKIPSPEVYDLAASMNNSASVRYSMATREPLVTLFKQPDPVSTRPTLIVPLNANDTGTVKSLYNNTTSLATGVQSNLFDLSFNANQFGFNAIDYTDLVAPGGRVSYLYVLATKVDGGVTTTELFQVPTRYLAQAIFVGSPNNMDSGDVLVNMAPSFMIRNTSKNAQGATTTMFAAYNDGVVQLDLNFTANLNLKTSYINGNGNAKATLKPINGSTSVGGTTTSDFAMISFAVVAYDTELYFDEENLRKTTTAVRLNWIERQFVIPMGRNFIVDYSLNQQASEDVARTVDVVTSLGNSARNLGIMQSRLDDMYAALQFEQNNPEMVGMMTARMQSPAGTLCIPYVIQDTLDFSDPTIAVMRESERLTELHGRLRERMLTALTTICNMSLYLNNLEAGEKAVFKILTAQPIADQLFGIMDYHNLLNDKLPPENGADYTMELPNGYRLDIIKTNFDDYANMIMAVPVREADPKAITSFGTVHDRGTYVAQYTPINQGGVARRVVSNSREIVFATNIVGAVITVTNLATQLGPQS